MRTNIIEWVILALSYLSTGGVWATDFGKRHKTLVVLLGLFAIANSAYFVHDRWSDWFGSKEQSSDPTPKATAERPPPSVNSTPATGPTPSLEKIFPPETVVDVRPFYGAKDATFMLANWVSWRAKNIQITTWTLGTRGWQKVGSRRFAYLGSGDSVNFSEPIPRVQPVVFCISYYVNSRHVEALHFFTNSEGVGYRRARDTVLSVDGAYSLCSSMPSVASRYL